LLAGENDFKMPQFGAMVSFNRRLKQDTDGDVFAEIGTGSHMTGDGNAKGSCAKVSRKGRFV